MAGETAHYLLADEPIKINQGRPTVTLDVWNTGDRAIQVGSHFHFFEVNRALRFDRSATFGMRLNIPAGTAARFEMGEAGFDRSLERRKEIRGPDACTVNRLEAVPKGRIHD